MNKRYFKLLKICLSSLKFTPNEKWFRSNLLILKSKKIKFYITGTLGFCLSGIYAFGSNFGSKNEVRSFSDENKENNGIIGSLLSTFKVYSLSKRYENFLADVIEKAEPAVVFIEVKHDHPVSGKRVTLSNGSGFIVKRDGLILTNAHVVANKTEVRVKLANGKTVLGRVAAMDPVLDLAAVQIDENNLPVLPLGNSSKIRPGEFVVAMGSPFSLTNTSTCGIVSNALRGSRELGLNNENLEYIQTDAVVNFGNSGGPLVDLDGTAIGINSMKIATGISFAIPIQYAIKFLHREIGRMTSISSDSTKRKYNRYVGIKMLTLTPDLIRELRESLRHFPDVASGVYVYEVTVGSPAYIAGMHAGDIIVKINGSPLSNLVDIYTELEKSLDLDAVVIRGNRHEKIGITAEEIF